MSWIEQHAEVALRLTKKAVMIERGLIAHRAQSSDLLCRPDMLARHLGLRLQER